MNYNEIDRVPSNGGFERVWCLDVYPTRKCIPRNLYEEVRQLWQEYALGNDYFYVKVCIHDYKDCCPIITEYIKEHIPGISEDEEVLVRFWW